MTHGRVRLARGQGGFLVVTALMFAIILLLLGMGLMQVSANRYRAATYALQSAQARALAMSGLDDARFKFQNDVSFPPLYDDGGGDALRGLSFATADQKVFSYLESHTMADGTAASYSVTVNTTYGVDPFYIYRVDSMGVLGPSSQPIAVYHVSADLDVSTDPSRHFARYTHVQDDSAL